MAFSVDTFFGHHYKNYYHYQPHTNTHESNQWKFLLFFFLSKIGRFFIIFKTVCLSVSLCVCIYIYIYI